MSAKRCPNCKTIYFANPNTGDFIHNCNIPSVGSTIGTEDVLIIGNWEDFEGSGTKPSQEVLMAGISNKTTVSAQASEKDINELNFRGNKSELYRQRSRLQYIKDPMNPGDSY